MSATEEPFVFRLKRFLGSPWQNKKRWIRYHFKFMWHRLFPNVPLPTRLTPGIFLWTWDDPVDFALYLRDPWEERERRFIEKTLKPGMVVLDVGAHHGIYTILASKMVGNNGLVIAFEPSPERSKLKLNVRLTRYSPVKIETYALGNSVGEAEFFYVPSSSDCSGLRSPFVNLPVYSLKVPVIPLDNYLEKTSIDRVDFMKVDTEGAELEVLKGASQLLSGELRPIIMCEVVQVTCHTWGYAPKEIISFLGKRGFHWYRITERGGLVALADTYDNFGTAVTAPNERNYIAVPEERLEVVGHATVY